MKRREFLALAGTLAAGAILPVGGVQGTTGAHVVILGGGVGGATTAKYLRLMDPQIRVTVVERNARYLRPYGSSEVISGHVGLDDLEISYATLESKYGVDFVQDEAIGFDPDRQTLDLVSGERLSYDRLVVSPGIQLVYDAIEGHSDLLADVKYPAAWIPGRQTQLLRNQVQSMRPGGTLLIVAPPNPYRCPPGPYERGALVAEWLQKHNPRAKVLIIDPKDRFVTDRSMMLGWNRLYGYNIPFEFMEGMPDDVQEYSTPGMIDWIPVQDGGAILSLDAAASAVETEGGRIEADVINLIPPMRAGRIAERMGLTDESGYCPIDPMTFESRRQPKVHVIGDACIADQMPKSGYSANNQAKVTARALVDLFAGREPGTPSWQNTCYALAGSEYGLYVAAVFKLKEGRIMADPAVRFQPLDATPAQIRLGAVYQQNWLDSFTQDCFA